MQKQLLDHDINFKSFIKTTKEENFEHSFLLIFGKQEKFEENFDKEIYFHQNISLVNQNKNITKAEEKLNIPKNNIKIETKIVIPLKGEIDVNDKKKVISIVNNNVNKSITDDDRTKKIIKFKSEKSIELKNNINTIKLESKIDNSISSTKIWKRGPYKKKKKEIIKTKTDDKCFPFVSGNGLIKSINCEYNKKESIHKKEKNELTILKNNFIVKHYHKVPKGKNNKAEKPRKFKSDDIRKKIKVNFHKELKNIINRNLKKAGSEVLLSFLPQSFLSNISKKLNYKYMNSTYEEILSLDFTKFQLKVRNLEIEQKQYIKNLDLLKYLQNNPQISKNSGFDMIKKMKYRDLLKAYFESKEFENTISQFRNKNESDDYINTYILLAKNYISYFTNSKKH
jgi:hypothetical protein